MIIRDAREPDRLAIAAVVAAAFGRPDEAAIVDELKAQGDLLIELVAESAGEVVGHILFSRTRCDPPRLIAGLAPLAVAPDRQGGGVGSALCREGLAACRRAGVQAVVVLGAPAYYGRFGFSAANARNIRCRYSSLAGFMALPLIAGALDQPIDLAYPPALG